MSLYGRIVDGQLVRVGQLPESERRLDTNKIVHGLPTTGAMWRRACGWFPLDELDVDELGSLYFGGDEPTAEQRAAVRQAVTAALEARTLRDSVIDKVHNLGDMARDVNWDWLDHNCDGQVAQMAFVRNQSPNAGSAPPAWGSLNTFEKAEALRQGVSYALVENIRVSQALDLLVDVVAGLIAAASNVTPPPDR